MIICLPVTPFTIYPAEWLSITVEYTSYKVGVGGEWGKPPHFSEWGSDAYSATLLLRLTYTTTKPR